MTQRKAKENSINEREDKKRCKAVYDDETMLELAKGII